MSTAAQRGRPELPVNHDTFEGRMGFSLRMARKCNSLTLGQAAERSGVSAATISAAERGLVGLSVRVLVALAKAYGRRVADLIPEGMA